MGKYRCFHTPGGVFDLVIPVGLQFFMQDVFGDYTKLRKTAQFSPNLHVHISVMDFDA